MQIYASKLEETGKRLVTRLSINSRWNLGYEHEYYYTRSLEVEIPNSDGHPMCDFFPKII